jgi:hypothetical protein
MGVSIPSPFQASAYTRADASLLIRAPVLLELSANLLNCVMLLATSLMLRRNLNAVVIAGGPVSRDFH